MTCSWDNWGVIVTSILGTYSAAISVVTISLILHVRSLRRRYYSIKDLSNESSNDERDNLPGFTENRCYEIETLVRTKETLKTIPSVPVEERPESIYNPETSASVVRRPPLSKESAKGTQQHHYEKILPETSGEPHHYETIIENVCSTLTDIYKQNRQDDAQIYQMFVEELFKKLKNKDSEFYETLRKKNTPHYETILNDHSRAVSKSDYDSDDTYAKYMPAGKDSLMGMSVSNNNVNEGKFEIKSYGSYDHLKFLTESRRDLVTQKIEEPYLQPKQFSPRSDCPEKLRAMCETQDPETSSTSTEPSEQNPFMTEYQFSLSSSPTHPPSTQVFSTNSLGRQRINGRFTARNQQDLDVNSTIVECRFPPSTSARPSAGTFSTNAFGMQGTFTLPNQQGNGKKQGPPVPPKKQRSRSGGEDDNNSIL